MNGKTVLIIEDNELNMKLAADLLGLAGLNVVKAFDGQTALAILEILRPDLILLDLDLPDINGFELYAHIRKNSTLRSIKMAAFTASVMQNEEDRADREGFDGFFQKPIDAKVFAHKIQCMLEPELFSSEMTSSGHNV